MKFKFTLILLSLVLLSSCAFNQNKDEVEVLKKTIDFEDVYWYAERASAAYRSETEIKKAFSDVTHVVDVLDKKIRFFIFF